MIPNLIFIKNNNKQFSLVIKEWLLLGINLSKILNILNVVPVNSFKEFSFLTDWNPWNASQYKHDKLLLESTPLLLSINFDLKSEFKLFETEGIDVCVDKFLPSKQQENTKSWVSFTSNAAWEPLSIL